MTLYDPFFWPDSTVFEGKFDFITASEVMEHLYSPKMELQRLFAMLRPGGWLGVMTLFYDARIDFAGWHYRRDPTHVAFYSHRTLVWLALQLGFEKPIFSGERIALLRRPA